VCNVSILSAGLLLSDIVSGTLTAKRHPASSKVTSETPKIPTGAAVQAKPPTSANGKSSVKKTTVKRDTVTKLPAKKDTTKTEGLLALCLI